MTTPSTLLAPACSAYPKFAGVLNALAAVISADTPAPVVTPPPPPSANPAAFTIHAGQYLMFDGAGSIAAFDFGDPSAQFNSLRGYNAAHIYDTPGIYHASTTIGGQNTLTAVTVVPDPRPLVALAPGADLAATIAKLTAPTILLLPAGSQFDIAAPATISTDNITLRAAGPGVAPRIRRITDPNTYSCIIVTGSNVSIEGIEFDSDKPMLPANNLKVGVFAVNVQGKNLLVRNCNFRNVDQAILGNPQASGLVVVNCNFTNELRSCAVYTDAMPNVVILGLTAVGSVCEHIVRLEGSVNVLIHGGDYNNHDGKETIAVRKAGCVAVVNNTFRCWARVSEAMSYQPGTYCTKILFASNHFAGLRADGPWVQVDPGVQTILFDANTFDVDASQGCVAIQAPSTDVNFTNNTLSMTPGTTTCKPLVRPFGNPAFAESGTAVVQAPLAVSASKK
jgi:PKD repeat protein